MIEVIKSVTIPRLLVHELNDTVIVYCGREFAGFPESPLHNPNMLNGGDRGAALKRYKTEILWPQIQSRQGEAWGMLEWLVQLAQIEDAHIRLACWCAPEACHCDVIKAAVEVAAAGELSEYFLSRESHEPANAIQN
jgi:hypothetical protein